MVVSGASIAIDDCYELWESGFVSIPYDFELRDLQPQLQKLLQGARAESNSSSDSLELSNDGYWTKADAQLADRLGDQDKLRHSREEDRAGLFMEGSVSADTAGSMPGNALAGAPIERPFSNSTADFNASSSACSAVESKLEPKARKQTLPLAESRRYMPFRLGKQELLVPRLSRYQRHNLPHQTYVLSARLK